MEVGLLRLRWNHEQEDGSCEVHELAGDVPAWRWRRCWSSEDEDVRHAEATASSRGQLTLRWTLLVFVCCRLTEEVPALEMKTRGRKFRWNSLAREDARPRVNKTTWLRSFDSWRSGVGRVALQQGNWWLSFETSWASLGTSQMKENESLWLRGKIQRRTELQRKRKRSRQLEEEGKEGENG